MKTFKDLQFNTHPNASVGFGKQATMFFENGYGCSVITGKGSYSNDSSPYELAVLIGNEEKYELCYTTSITDDVLGYCTEQEVTEAMAEIQALK